MSTGWEEGTVKKMLVSRCAIFVTILMLVTGSGPAGAQTVSVRDAVTSIGAGAWTNTRLVKTAAYTVQSGDKGKTIALGGSACYALTFPPAAGSDANFAVVVVNEDAGRAKTIAPTGATEFFLWPGQSTLVFKSGNAWKYTEAGRWRLMGNVTLYLDAENGSDANDGLAEGRRGALKSVMAAQLEMQRMFDFNHHVVVVQLAPGVYTSRGQDDIMHFDGRPVGGHSAAITLRGAGSTKTILNSTGGNALAVYYDSILRVEGLRVQARVGSCIVASRKGLVYVGKDVDFGPAGSCHLVASHDGLIMLESGAYSISGSAYAHTNTGGKGMIIMCPTKCDILANVAFKCFAIASSLSYQAWPGTTFDLHGHTVTGQRYAVSGNALIEGAGGNETLFPGSGAGSVSAGGLYR
jgi:hypothetical protein